jgi:hypothetical protein
MDEVIKFISAFLANEFEAIIQRWTEKDDEKFEQAEILLGKYYTQGISSGLARPLDMEEGWFLTRKQALKRHEPRKLFQIKHYFHPEYYDLYRCYLSTTEKGASLFFTCYFVAKKDGELKIISKYIYSFERNDWKWQDGIQFETFGKLVEVRQFIAPTHPKQLDEYNDHSNHQ